MNESQENINRQNGGEGVVFMGHRPILKPSYSPAQYHFLRGCISVHLDLIKIDARGQVVGVEDDVVISRGHVSIQKLRR